MAITALASVTGVAAVEAGGRGQGIHAGGGGSSISSGSLTDISGVTCCR